MIEVADLKKTFGKGASQLDAVKTARFTIEAGDFALIFGRSGSGKTTLLGMLAGLIRPTSGSVRVLGEEITRLADDRISDLRAKEIGFIFQFSGLVPTLSVIGNVMLPTLFCRDGTGGKARARELLKNVGLADRADAYPRVLSGGEMKRVAIARALINRPSLLLADEPTGDLDAATEYEIMELFRELNNEGITIVMVTHNPDLVSYGSRTFVMDRGVLEERPVQAGAGRSPGGGNNSSAGLP